MATVAQPPAPVSNVPPATVEPVAAEVKEEPPAAADEEKTATSDNAAATKPAEVKNEDGDQNSAPSSEKDGDGAKSPSGPGADTSTRFDLEPNPFEQSFSRGSHSQDRTTPPRGGDATSIKHNALPPLSSLTSPAAADPTQFPWLAGQSLRSGPLSPAMLAGPAQSNNQNNNQNNSSSNSNQAWGPSTENAATSEETFEPGNFRTGFTPGTGSGFTPGYNALLNPGFGNIPIPSPNTAAFLANITSVANESGDQQAPSDQRQPQPASGLQQPSGPHGMSHLNPAHQSAETITPGTLNAIASDLNGQQPPPGMAPGFYPGMQPQPGMVAGMPPADYAQQNANAASQAANGLFLLSQAHQELSKREEEAKSTPPLSKRGPPSGVSASKPAGQKRKEPAGKGNAAKKSKKSPEIELSEDDSDNESRKSGGEKKSRNETEEEKRKNFLERNRQAALKCRQRKKAWLNELQNKVETLTMDNERLVHNVRGLEEEVNRLTNILMTHRDCGIGMPPMQQAYGRPLR